MIFVRCHLVITFAAAKVLQINQLCKFFQKGRGIMALFFQKGRGIIVLFFQKGRGMTVFFLNATSFGNTIGDLWEFCGLSVAVVS